MRVLVCGGRDYGRTPDERRLVRAALDRLENVEVVIEGGASGADMLAAAWAEAHDVECETYSADWHKHGRAAGPIRNQRMLDEGKPDLVIAFTGGRGTTDMVTRAKKAGIEVIEVHQ
jgi:SLOG family YspA-like protein